jgi:hypothetical protein
MTPASALAFLIDALRSDGALVTLFVLIGLGGWRRVWCWGYQLTRADQLLTEERLAHIAEIREAHDERDRWREACQWMMGNPHLGERPPGIPGPQEPGSAGRTGDDD